MAAISRKKEVEKIERTRDILKDNI